MDQTDIKVGISHERLEIDAGVVIGVVAYDCELIDKGSQGASVNLIGFS